MPTLSDGDLVMFGPIKEPKDNLSEGSIVVLKHPLEVGTFIVKRIHSIKDSCLELRGDNEPLSTDSRHFGLVNQNQILGIVQEVIYSKR